MKDISAIDVSNSKNPAELADFWRAELANAPPLLNLPTDRSRPAKQSQAVASITLTLEAELSAQLREYSARHASSPYLTLLTSWLILLHRITGQSDLLVGVVTSEPSSQREQFLPLRLHCDGKASVAHTLAQVQGQLARSQAFASASWQALLDALQVNASPSYHPLFQVGVAATQSEAAQPLWSRGLDLSVSLKLDGEQIEAQLHYASDIFDASTIQRWAQHWRNLLLDILLCDTLANDQHSLSQLNLLSTSERQHLLQGLNQTYCDFPRQQTVQQVFEAQVQAQPDAIALLDMAESISYAELNRRANQLAHRLIAIGIKPDDPVAVCAERSSAMVIAMLAVLKAGGAYVPLDASHPTERLAYMLADCAPKVLLLQPSLANALPAHSIPILELVPLASASSDAPQHNPEPQAWGLQSDHLAYIIYTSGSTGEPKGVMVEHRNILRLIINPHDAYAKIDASDCVVHCANPAFDAATWEIWGALLNGARLLIISQQVLLEPNLLKQAIQQHGVTILHLTVGIFNQYASALADVFPHLKSLLFGGDQSDPSKVMQVFNSAAPRHLIHCYGPTETTTFATTYEIDARTGAPSNLPIGKPIANTQVYVLDTHMQPVPIGVVGELYIGGEGLARGYLKRPDLSAERFLPDPFSDAAQARIYKTGDLARWLANGNLEFLGRNDRQVKIRGFRVELGEIETTLSQHASIRDTLVLALETPHGDKQLVAYYTLADTSKAAPVQKAMDFDWSDMLGHALAAAAPTAASSAPAAPAAPMHTTLATHLRQSLPDYMIPVAFVHIASMPITANGKPDRQALPAPQLADYASPPYEAAQGQFEIECAKLWADLLNVERVGRQDNFFALGGHSILAVQLVARMSSHFQLDVTLADLGNYPTLAQLAGLVSELATQ